MHADNRMHPKLTEFADILWGTRVLYQVKLLVSKGLKRGTVPPNAECWIVDVCATLVVCLMRDVLQRQSGMMDEDCHKAVMRMTVISRHTRSTRCPRMMSAKVAFYAYPTMF